MEALNDDNIAGWSFLAMFVLLAIAVVISGCSASQSEADAAERPARFSMECVERVDGAATVTVSILHDSETDRRWLYVRDTTYGKPSIYVEPIEGSGDGAVSDQL